MGGWNLVDKVQIGGFSITNLPVVFADVSPFHQLHLDNKPALLLGMDVLQRFDRIAVDFGRKRVHFLLPDSVAAESPRLATGYRPRKLPAKAHFDTFARLNIRPGGHANKPPPPL